MFGVRSITQTEWGPSTMPDLDEFRVLTGPHWIASPISLSHIRTCSYSSRQHLLPHLVSPHFSVTLTSPLMSAQATVSIARNATTSKLLARVPPPAFSQATHRSRCLAQLRSKHNNLEMYIYLNGLKDRDPSLFYTLLFDNMRESTPRFFLTSVSYAVLAVHRKWSQSCTLQP